MFRVQTNHDIYSQEISRMVGELERAGSAVLTEAACALRDARKMILAHDAIFLERGISEMNRSNLDNGGAHSMVSCPKCDGYDIDPIDHDTETKRTGFGCRSCSHSWEA